jgi:hypothetical protein
MAKLILIGGAIALMAAAGATTLGLKIPKQAAAQHHDDPIFWQLQKLREDGALP